MISIRQHRGSILIEALVSILIFSLGILAMMNVSKVAVSAQTDALIRGDAAKLANEIVQQIWLGVDRSSASNKAAFQASLQKFAYQPSGTECNFSGDDSAKDIASVSDWLQKIKSPTSTSHLPGSLDAYQQIKVDLAPADGGNNEVTVTICWKNPSDVVARQHSMVAQVN